MALGLKVLIVGSDAMSFNGRIVKTRHRLNALGADVQIMRLHLYSRANGFRKDDPGADLQAYASRLVLELLQVVPSSLARPIAFRSLLKDVFRHFNAVLPDALHVMDPYALKVAVLWKRQSGADTAIIFDACEWFPGTAAADAATGRYIQALLSEFGPELSAWVCSSEALSKLYTDSFPEWPSPYLFGNVPDWDLSRPVQRTASPLRKTLGVVPEDIVLLFSGAFNRCRGIEALLRGASDLQPHTHLAFMGYGPLTDEIQSYANAHSNVHLIDAVAPTELQAWLSGADAGLIPYQTDIANHRIATPNKLYEFPCAGVPLLSRDLPIIHNTIITHGIGSVLDEPAWGGDTSDGAADFSIMTARIRSFRRDEDLDRRLFDFSRISHDRLLGGLDAVYSGAENRTSSQQS